MKTVFQCTSQRGNEYPVPAMRGRQHTFDDEIFKGGTQDRDNHFIFIAEKMLEEQDGEFNRVLLFMGQIIFREKSICPFMKKAYKIHVRFHCTKRGFEMLLRHHEHILARVVARAEYHGNVEFCAAKRAKRWDIYLGTDIQIDMRCHDGHEPCAVNGCVIMLTKIVEERREVFLLVGIRNAAVRRRSHPALQELRILAISGFMKAFVIEKQMLVER
jgi:hypothetical protein